MSLDIEIKSAVTCDEIRREDNGKAIAIGIYTGDILVSEFPANLRLTWLLLGKTRGSGERRFEIQIRCGQTTVAAHAELTGPGEVESDFALVLPGVPVTIDQPGTLTLSLKENGEWRELLSKRVRNP